MKLFYQIVQFFYLFADFQDALHIAKMQVENGAQVLDIKWV